VTIRVKECNKAIVTFCGSYRDFVASLAFLDESDSQPRAAVAGTYVLAAAVVEAEELTQVNAVLRRLVRPEDDHRRLHFSRMDKARRVEMVAVLGALRGTRFVVAWATGYTGTKDRERVRAVVLEALLTRLTKDTGMEQIFIEQREEARLRAADARVAGRIRDHDPMTRAAEIVQVRASEQPGLWLADAAAAAWRRELAEHQSNWSAFYRAHTELVAVEWPVGRR
jgi:hypothetical protein